MAEDDDGSGTGLSRRRMLYGLGAAGSAGILAGCGSGDGGGGDTTTTTTTEGGGGDGGGGDTTTTTTTETTQQMSDQTFRYTWSRDAPLGESNINMYAPNEQHELTWIVMAEQGDASVATGEWFHLDVDSWEFDMDNNELLMTFKDGVKWHQGGEVIDDYLGEDFAMQQHMQRLMVQGNPDANPAENPSIVEFDHDGGKTYVGKLNPDGVNQAVIENGFPRQSFAVYRDFWREDYERAVDASTTDELSEVRSDVIQTNVVLQDDPPLSGPYMLKNGAQSVSAQAVDMVRVPEHWSSEFMNWKNFRLVKLSASSGASYQAGVSDRADYSMGIPETVDSPPETITQLFTASGGSSTEVVSFNYGGEMDSWFGFDAAEPAQDNTAGKQQAKVRQAMAWAFDAPQIVGNRYGKYEGQSVAAPTKALMANPNKFQQRFPDLYEQIPDTLASAQPDKAEQALEESGLTKENGTWVKPDGSPLTVQMESHSWSRDLVETAVQNLKDVGVQAEHIVQESSVLFSRQGGGESAATQAWLGRVDPLASNALNWVRRGWPVIYQPNEWQVPPVGEWDAEPTETFDAQELAAKLETTSFEQHEEELKKLHWIGAYHLPMVPVAPLPNGHGWNNRHFTFPDHPERSANGRITVPGDGSQAAPAHAIGQQWRQFRKGLAPPNNIDAKM